MESRHSAWSKVTPLLLFSCFCLLVGDVLFGYDTGSFSGILANTVGGHGAIYRIILTQKLGIYQPVWHLQPRDTILLHRLITYITAQLSAIHRQVHRLPAC